MLSEKKEPMSTGQHTRCHRSGYLAVWGEVGRLAAWGGPHGLYEEGPVLYLEGGGVR